MGFRDDMRALAHSVRAIPGRDFEIRPYTVSVVVRSFAGDHPGEGVTSTSTTAITEADGQPPKVRFLNDEQIALGGPDLTKGSVVVGPITPDFPGGGTAVDVLNGGGAQAGDLFYYVLTGPGIPDGARFLLHELKSDRAFRYMVTLRPLSTND